MDVYSEVFDPYEPRKAPVPARISDDLADIITDLRHGMAHYRSGRTTEALWWWQFSYFSNCPTASAVLRALQSVLIHVRLNQPLEELDGLDTDQATMGDETLEFEAGRVMAREIGGPLGVRPGK